MAQSIRSRYHEHAGEERSTRGYHKPKNKKKAFENFKESVKKKMCKNCGKSHKCM